ncbi:MAG: RluA family pseudouridine synthase [Bdellovibrionota bacterium]
MLAFRILYEDEAILAVDKPAGFHTHPPEDQNVRISPKWNGLRILERQLQMKLYPVHRLDRASSGVLILSKKRELNHALHSQFAERKVHKQYALLARGEIKTASRIEEALSQEDGPSLPAITEISPIHSFALKTAPEELRTFTLAWAYPETGRFHQIRRHLAHAGHPLLGDSRHGDKKLNRAVTGENGLDRLFLRCKEMHFLHPETHKEMRVSTRWSREWHKLFELGGYCPLPEKRF